MSFICALILGWVDRRAERILQRNNNPLGEIAKLGFDDIMRQPPPYCFGRIIFHGQILFDI